MVKHNNVVPNAHFHKKWKPCTSRMSTGVKVNLHQAMQKKARRLKRAAKAAAIAPRPSAGLLRPVVRCPTQRYNMKLRTGRGFTLEELKAAGFNKKEARNIGVAVDARRKNKSVESLQQNVDRLKAYKARLIVFPRGSGKNAKGGASAAERAMAVQLTGDILPNDFNSKGAVQFEAIPTSNVYQDSRKARADAKLIGKRERRRIEKEEAAAASASKKKKGKK